MVIFDQQQQYKTPEKFRSCALCDAMQLIADGMIHSAGHFTKHNILHQSQPQQLQLERVYTYLFDELQDARFFERYN